MARPGGVKKSGRFGAAATAAILLLVAGGAVGLVSGQTDDHRNAALWYRKAFERLDGIAVSEAEWEVVRAFRLDPGARPSPDLLGVLLRLQPVFDAVERGSKQPYCDFELDYGEGLDLEVPHLTPLRRIARLMATDALVRLPEGDAAAATAAASALYRVADHLCDDRLIISSLVGQAIFRSSDRVVQSGIDRGAFGAVESGQLRNALRGVEGRDPFRIVDALLHEKDMVIGWAKEKYGASEDRAWMLQDLDLDAGAEMGLVGLALLDESQFEAALEQTDLMMDRVVTVFELDDPVEAGLELEQLRREIRDGEHGMLAVILAPAYSGLYAKMTEAQTQVAQRSALLQAIASGRLDPAAIANAAVWYLRAIEMLDGIEPTLRERLRLIVADPLEPLDAETKQALTEAGPIVDTLREASQRARCDFSIAPGAAFLIPGYLPGMREAARLLGADAVRFRQQGDNGQAAERLAISYRMSAHLAGEARLAAALVSHVVFAAAEPLLEPALSEGSFSRGHRTTILLAVETMPRRDAFGYKAGLDAAREKVRDWLAECCGDGEEGSKRARELVGRLDGDQLLYLRIVGHEPGSAGEPSALLSADGGRALDDVISPEGLTLALEAADEVRSIVESGRWDSLFEEPAPPIGNVRQRMESAPRDLRRVTVALRSNTSSAKPRE